MHQFLFDTDHRELKDELLQGPPCTQRVVRAIESLPHMAATRLLRGSVIPPDWCYKLAGFEIGGPMAARKPGGPVSRSDRYEYQPDNNLFRTVVCDLAESMAEPPSTVPEELLLLCLARRSIWAVGASHLTDNEALSVDSVLRDFTPYIGMVKIDLGNPVQREVMVETMLHKDIVLSPEGIIYHAKTYLPKEDQDEELHWVKLLGSSKEPIGLEYDEFEKALPSISYPAKLSKRGDLTQRRIDGKVSLGHRDRLALALLARFDVGEKKERLEFSTARSEGVEEFSFDPRKFTEYLLNVHHRDGGGKAKFFVEVLGIEPSDWEFLADQIRRGMGTAPIYRAGRNAWGFTHGALVQVQGRNGKSAILETGWLIGSGSSANFVTAYPYDGPARTDAIPANPFIVSMDLDGDARWEAIYTRAEAAGLEAADRAQPTPMILSGYGAEWEGVCGFGWVLLPSARQPMAKWLLKTNRGDRARPGVSIWSSAETQSLERNRAWAEAFAEVLIANGIECSARSRID